MIEINLLQQEQEEKNRRLAVEPKNLLYLVPLGFLILITAHIYFAALNAAAYHRYSALNKKWKELEPQRKMLENFNKEYDTSSQDAGLIHQLIGKRINWSQKLNKLSLSLPSGIWFNEVLVSPKEFVLHACAVSLQKEEMGLISKLINNLKNDADFIKDFNNLELSSAQKKTIGGYDITDFILAGALRSQ